MSRRASLPSADALFGTDTGARARSDEPTDPEVDGRVLTEVRRLTAAEDEAIVEARDRAAGTVPLPSPEVGALLRWAVLTCGVRTAVEVGAAGGVTGLWLLGCLPQGGVLTSIEPDPHAQSLAAEAFKGAAAGSRVRGILGDADTVLSRLSDGSYDLLLLQSSPAGLPGQLGHARRLLRPGGVLIARAVLRAGEHAEAQARFVHDLAEAADFNVVVLPVDDGIALATRIATEDD
jgi:predicted O-methyltransferase YrrM